MKYTNSRQVNQLTIQHKKNIINISAVAAPLLYTVTSSKSIDKCWEGNDMK